MGHVAAEAEAIAWMEGAQGLRAAAGTAGEQGQGHDQGLEGPMIEVDIVGKGGAGGAGAAASGPSAPDPESAATVLPVADTVLGGEAAGAGGQGENGGGPKTGYGTATQMVVFMRSKQKQFTAVSPKGVLQSGASQAAALQHKAELRAQAEEVLREVQKEGGIRQEMVVGAGSGGRAGQQQGGAQPGPWTVPAPVPEDRALLDVLPKRLAVQAEQLEGAVGSLGQEQGGGRAGGGEGPDRSQPMQQFSGTGDVPKAAAPTASSLLAKLQLPQTCGMEPVFGPVLLRPSASAGGGAEGDVGSPGSGLDPSLQNRRGHKHAGGKAHTAQRRLHMEEGDEEQLGMSAEGQNGGGDGAGAEGGGVEAMEEETGGYGAAGRTAAADDDDQEQVALLGDPGPGASVPAAVEAAARIAEGGPPSAGVYGPGTGSGTEAEAAGGGPWAPVPGGAAEEISGVGAGAYLPPEPEADRHRAQWQAFRAHENHRASAGAGVAAGDTTAATAGEGGAAPSEPGAAEGGEARRRHETPTGRMEGPGGDAFGLGPGSAVGEGGGAAAGAGRGSAAGVPAGPGGDVTEGALAPAYGGPATAAATADPASVAAEVEALATSMHMDEVPTGLQGVVDAAAAAMDPVDAGGAGIGIVGEEEVVVIGRKRKSGGADAEEKEKGEV